MADVEKKEKEEEPAVDMTVIHTRVGIRTPVTRRQGGQRAVHKFYFVGLRIVPF